MDLRVLGFLGMFTIVFSAMGALIGFLFLGVFGAIIVSGVFFVITLIIDFMSILRSQKPILRRFHAKESDDEKLNKIVEEMALNARVPKPKVYILQMDIPNSFSLGKNKKKASVCITEGALSMNKNEIKNIIAHEMFHIANEDTYIQSVAVALTNMLRSTFILRPFAVFFIRLALSDVREYKADYYGTRYSRKPLDMASAIKKMSEVALQNRMEGSPVFSNLWMVNPYKRTGLSGLYSTHPPTARRVNRVESMGHEGMPEPFEMIGD